MLGSSLRGFWCCCGTPTNCIVVLEVSYGERDIVLDNLRSVMISMQDLSEVYIVFAAEP